MDGYNQLVSLLRKISEPNFWTTLRQHIFIAKQHVRNSGLYLRDLQREHFRQHQTLMSEETLQDIVREWENAAAECEAEALNLLEQYKDVRPLLSAIAPTMLGMLPFFQTWDKIEQIDPPQIAQLMNEILGHVLANGDPMIPITPGELTRRFNREYTTIHRWADSGRIRVTKIDRANWLIHRDDLMRFTVLEKT